MNAALRMLNAHSPILRLTALVLVLAGLLMAPASAAEPSLLEKAGQWLRADAAGQFTVVLVDTTSSVSPEDRAQQAKAAKALAAGARPGDRVVLAAVADRAASRFAPVADVALSKKGNALQDEARARKARAEIESAIGALLDGGGAGSKGTYIIDAVGGSGELFASARKIGMPMRLVVLSDMIEESPLANFARGPADASVATRIVAQQRKAGTLPDLQGVRVVVGGASGRSANQMAQIRGFWEAYFRAAGAQVEHYGRSLDLAAGR